MIRCIFNWTAILKFSHKDTDEIKILSGKDNIFTFIKHWPYKSQANMHLRVSYPGGVMAGKCHMQVANCKSQVIYSPKHLQEKGNLFLIRSMNNLRNRKELTLRLTSIISKNKLTHPEWYSFTNIMIIVEHKIAYTKENQRNKNVCSTRSV